jgi:acetoin utilization deacetylase AcuC-like enzyme
MLVLYSSSHKLHVPKTEYYDGRADDYAEKPARIESILDACKDLDLPMQNISRPLTKRELKAVHDKHYVDYFANRCQTIPEHEQLISSVFIRDTYSPIMRHTYNPSCHHARRDDRAGDIAHKHSVARPTRRFSLLRPQGQPTAVLRYRYVA